MWGWFVVTVECPMTEDIANAERLGEGVVLGTVIPYFANPGYWFIDHSFTFFIACLADGTWQPALPPVVGKHNHQRSLKKYANTS